MQPAVAEVIAGAMERARAVRHGASRAAISGYTVLRQDRLRRDQRRQDRGDQRWFTGFIRDEQCPYAVAVVVEQGGAGSTVATRHRPSGAGKGHTDRRLGGDAVRSEEFALKLKNLPDSPGCYLMKSGGEVIYVGKAVNLKNRVRQYFQSASTTRPRCARCRACGRL